MMTLAIAATNLPEPAKWLVDGASMATAVAAIVGALTSMVGLMATIASLAWACIRVYETKTFQAWLEKRKKKGK